MSGRKRELLLHLTLLHGWDFSDGFSSAVWNRVSKMIRWLNLSCAQMPVYTTRTRYRSLTAWRASNTDCRLLVFCSVEFRRGCVEIILRAFGENYEKSWPGIKMKRSKKRQRTVLLRKTRDSSGDCVGVRVAQDECKSLPDLNVTPTSPRFSFVSICHVSTFTALSADHFWLAVF